MQAYFSISGSLKATFPTLMYCIYSVYCKRKHDDISVQIELQILSINKPLISRSNPKIAQLYQRKQSQISRILGESSTKYSTIKFCVNKPYTVVLLFCHIDRFGIYSMFFGYECIHHACACCINKYK